MNHVNAIRCNDEYQCSHCGKSWDIHEEAPDCKMTLVEMGLYKTVMYFGLSVTIPENYTVITTDADGEVYAWEDNPYINGSSWYDPDIPFIHICKVNLHGLNWRETLRKC